MSDDDERSSILPDASRWWPYLSARSKAALELAGEDAVPVDVRVEIERILDHPIAPDARLTDADRQFIRTQQEAVD